MKPSMNPIAQAYLRANNKYDEYDNAYENGKQAFLKLSSSEKRKAIKMDNIICHLNFQKIFNDSAIEMNTTMWNIIDCHHVTLYPNGSKTIDLSKAYLYVGTKFIEGYVGFEYNRLSTAGYIDALIEYRRNKSDRRYRIFDRVLTCGAVIFLAALAICSFTGAIASYIL